MLKPIPEPYTARVTLTSNCGLLLEDREARILVDAIYDANEHFSPPPSELTAAVKGVRNTYSRVNALLFTHRHVDHFSEESVREYLSHHDVDALVVPAQEGRERISPVERSPWGRVGSLLEISLGQKTIFALPTLHQTLPSGESDPHMAYLVPLGNSQILILGDAAGSRQNLQALRGAGSIDVAFCNPLFFQMPQARMAMEDLGVGAVCLYHIPFEGDDRYLVRKLAYRSARHDSGFPDGVTVFGEPKQEILLL